VNAGFGLWQLGFGSTDTLDTANYAAARAAVMNFRGENSRILGINPTTLVVPPVATARAIACHRANALDTAIGTNLHRLNAFTDQVPTVIRGNGWRAEIIRIAAQKNTLTLAVKPQKHLLRLGRAVNPAMLFHHPETVHRNRAVDQPRKVKLARRGLAHDADCQPLAEHLFIGAPLRPLRTPSGFAVVALDFTLQHVHCGLHRHRPDLRIRACPWRMSGMGTLKFGAIINHTRQRGESAFGDLCLAIAWQGKMQLDTHLFADTRRLNSLGLLAAIAKAVHIATRHHMPGKG